MSAVAQPKKPFAKKPTKWQWRLAAGRLDKGVAQGRQGQLISVMSLTAYMTARDVANALRIEPHVAQGSLMKLLAKGAVERRIIPGSIYDVATTPPLADKKLPPGFDPRIRAGSIIGCQDWRGEFKKFLAVRPGVYGGRPGWILANVKGMVDGNWALRRENWKFVEQTPNPIAFNQGRYSECFEAPKPEPKPEPKNLNPFKVGDKIVGKVNGFIYGVLTVSADGASMNLLTPSGDRIWGAGHENYEAFVQPLPAGSVIPRPELLPMDVLSEVSKVFGIGSDKYARDDWATKDNGGGDHLAAAERHISKFRRGEKLENGHKGSGLHHIDHAIARLMMLRGKEIRSRA